MEETKHVAVVDFGGQYTQLIVRRVRELGFFGKLYALEEFAEMGAPGAIILSGGPKSTGEPDAPDIDFEQLKAYGVPVLGICYGMQLLNIKFGGSVEASDRREYGPAMLMPVKAEGLDRKSTRLNSSHKPISYAVFCLKKKTRCERSLCLEV